MAETRPPENGAALSGPRSEDMPDATSGSPDETQAPHECRSAAEIRRVLPMLRGLDRLLMRETRPRRLIEAVCDGLTQVIGYSGAWIALVDASRSGVTDAAASQLDDDYATLCGRLECGDYPACMRAALESDEACLIGPFGAECGDCPMMARCRSACVLVHRLALGRVVHGVVAAYLPTTPGCWEQDMLSSLCEDLAFALSRIADGQARFEAERALRQADDIIVRSPAVALVWKSTEGWPIEYVSANVTRMLGWEAEDLLSGRVPYADVIHPDDLERVTSEVDRATADTTVTMFTHAPYRVVARDGDVRWVEDMTTTRRRPDGSVYAYAGILLDITERKRAEDALQERERRLHRVLQTTRDGFWVVDADGRLVEVNEAYCRMSGYSRPELLQLRTADLDADGVDGETEIGIRRVQESGAAVFEAQHRRRDGTLFEVEISASRPEVGDGPLVCFCRDITERKRTEREASANHLRLLSIFDSIDEPVYVADMQTYEVVYVNEAMRRVFGLPEGRKCYDYLQAREAPCPFCTNDKLLGECAGRSYAWEFQNEINGRWYRCIDKAIAWPDGRTVRYEMALDITERKVAEGELRKFKTIIDTVNYGAAITDLEGCIEYTNDYFAHTHGFTVGELTGRHLSVLHTDAQMPAVTKALATLFEEGSFDLLEVPHAHRDGTEFPMLMNGILMRDSAGNPERLFVTATDLREHKRLEAQVQQAQKLESVGRLAGGVAHDLNNLLVPILGYGEMLLADLAPDSEFRAPLAAITQAGTRARDLVRQLLAFSRRQMLEFKPLDVNRVLHRFEELLRSTIREDIDIRILPGSSLPPAVGDVGQLEQVIMNLAINAQDAMPDGGTLTITTSVIDFDDQAAAALEGIEPGSYILLTVRDTGHGMDTETMEHAFEPFFTTKAEGEGTGLGLATVYGIVKQHGGSVRASSECDRGTTFEVYLPAAEQAPLPEETPGAAPTVARGPETVLLVDDHEQVRELAHTILTRYGYTVMVGKSGEDALALAEEHDGPLDLLLTDVVMPEMSGKELYEALVGRYPGLRVIYMSGYTEDVIAHRGVMDEGVNFIQKPFAVQSLAAKVREVLDAE